MEEPPGRLPPYFLWDFLEEEQTMVQLNRGVDASSVVVGLDVSIPTNAGREEEEEIVVQAGQGAEQPPQEQSGSLSGSREDTGLLLDTVRRSQAVVVLQKWVKALGRARNVAQGLLAQEADLDRIGAVFSSSSEGFESVVTQLRDRDFNMMVAKMLNVVLPKVAGKPGTPTGQSHIRPFLTSLMIKLHPEDVLSDDDKSKNGTWDDTAKLLCVAAGSAVNSTVALVESLKAVKTGEAGSLKAFRARLSSFVFSFNFINEALTAWQAWDAPRRALASMPMLVDAIRRANDAELTGQNTIANAAKLRVDKIKAAMSKLMGTDKAQETFQVLESAIAGGEQFVLLPPVHAGGPPHRLELALAPSRTSTPRSRPTTPTAGGGASSPRTPASPRTPIGGAAASPRPTGMTPRSSSLRGSPRPAAADLAAAGDLDYEVVPIPAGLAGLLRNEQLAHEIMLNPDFKIEDKGAPEGPLADAFPQIREKMERLFWEQLVVSLTPPDQTTVVELTPGAVGQARFAEEGAYYNARIDAVREDGQLEVTFLVDGEKAIKPTSAFRLKDSANTPDYTFLLQLIEEVREKLSDLTPNRADLGRELRERLDTELIHQMLTRGVMEDGAIRAMFRFMVERLADLQAPARAEATTGWFQAVDQEAEAALARSDIKAFVSLLPSIFKTLFDRIEETKRDIANAHVAMLRPFLTQHGVGYERQKFAERLRSGEVSTTVVTAWLADSLAEQAATDAVLTSALARGDSRTHRIFLSNALVSLLRRLGLPGVRLPETVAFDGRRLVTVRDELDRLTLVGVFSTILRQFVAGARARMTQETLAAMETKLYTLLQDAGGVKLPDLVEEVVSSARAAFTAADSTLTDDQAVTLRGVLSESAKPDNAVFRLLSSRLGEVLAYHVRNEGDAAKDAIARYGFRPFETQVSAAGLQLRRVFDHNMLVHGAMYSKLLLSHINGAATRDGAATTGRDNAVA